MPCLPSSTFFTGSPWICPTFGASSHVSLWVPGLPKRKLLTTHLCSCCSLILMEAPLSSLTQGCSCSSRCFLRCVGMVLVVAMCECISVFIVQEWPGMTDVLQSRDIPLSGKIVLLKMLIRTLLPNHKDLFLNFSCKENPPDPPY